MFLAVSSGPFSRVQHPRKSERGGTREGFNHPKVGHLLRLNCLLLGASRAKPLRLHQIAADLRREWRAKILEESMDRKTLLCLMASILRNRESSVSASVYEAEAILKEVERREHEKLFPNERTTA